MKKIVMQKVVNMPVLHLLCLVLIIGQNGIFTQILGIFMLTLGPTSRFVLIFPKTWIVLIFTPFACLGKDCSSTCSMFTFLMSTGNDLPITAHNAHRQTFSRERNVLNGCLKIKRPTEEKLNKSCCLLGVSSVTLRTTRFSNKFPTWYSTPSPPPPTRSTLNNVSIYPQVGQPPNQLCVSYLLNFQ